MVDMIRLEEIVSECFTNLTNSVYTADYSIMEKRLQEIMQTLPKFSSVELAMYLRTTYSYSDRLPTWAPLLNRAIEFGRMCGDPVNDIFYGLSTAKCDIINKNTGNLPIKE